MWCKIVKQGLVTVVRVCGNVGVCGDRRLIKTVR